ncbi:chemotaxis protein CheW [Tateyamaria omphalii]|uniref:chemotaxis protein CheW n=1 Tax=Tateyamaria omphalii TaxID=299262 RepID=UPI00167762E2|nr:chemotaxis protein CheW [Tateyamaria omphalii]GGX64315.1 chemotaxis protein CheW [Tateyamaria omphalii]
MTIPVTTKQKELLTFRLSDQEYALDIMTVREIRGWTRATPMPLAPSFMRGVINLRGTVLPIMDLAERLGLPEADQGERNVIVVVQLNGSTIGLLVNSVSDIITRDADELQTPPDATVQDDRNVIDAITLLNDRMIRVLNVSKVVVPPESDAA